MSEPRPTRLPPTLAVLLALTCTLGCEDEPIGPSGPRLHELRLVSAPAEHTDLAALGPQEVSHRELLDTLGTLGKDVDARGIFLRIGTLEGAWARAADLGGALAGIASDKRPIHCHFEITDNLGYALLARHCDRITMAPGGVLDLVGVSAEAIYAKDLLDALGLNAELMHVGRFKGAADAFTVNAMPDETRQTLDAILDRLQRTLLGAIAERAEREGPGTKPLRGADVQALLDGGPFTAAQALAAGLVDAVGYDDAARAEAKAAAKVEELEVHAQLSEPENPSLGDLIAMLSGTTKAAPTGKRLVLAYLTGTIMDGDPSSQDGSDAEPFVTAMRRFADDDDVRAVVLRVDSPGGSAPASDRMWHALSRLSKRKPVIVSVGDMAASGGYYIASAGTEILARDDSLVGSIGVVGGKVVAADLAERAGAHVEQLTRGKNAGWPSLVRRFSDSERTAIRALLQRTYALFIDRVARGRRLPHARIEAVAQGRLWTGAAAREAGLVDREGGLSEAIARARAAGSLADDAPLQVWPEERSLVQQLVQGVSVQGAGAAQRSARQMWQAAGLPDSALVDVLLQGESQVAAALPFALRIR